MSFFRIAYLATCYRPDVADFTLVRADLVDDTGGPWHDVGLRGPRVLLVLDGTIEATAGADAPPERLGRGESAYVAAGDGALWVRGHGVAVVAGTPVAVPGWRAAG